jgi:hypothetical protein
MAWLIDLLLALLWIGGSIGLVLVVHAAGRRWIAPPPTLEGAPPAADGHDHPPAVRDAAQVIGLRTAALFGVILAMVYAQELGQYQQVREGLSREAVAIADVFHDAGRYGGEVAAPVQAAMRDYVRYVVEREWRLLGTEKRLSRRAWDARERAYTAVLDAVPSTPREVALRERMLARLGVIAEHRHLREEWAEQGFGVAFWLPALAGLVLVTLPLCVFPPTRQTRLLLATLGAYAGLLLFFVQAFSSPFTYPLHDPPGAFERLLENDFDARAP